MSLLTPSEWQLAAAGMDEADDEAHSVRLLNQSRVASLPEGIRRQFALTGPDKQSRQDALMRSRATFSVLRQHVDLLLLVAVRVVEQLDLRHHLSNSPACLALATELCGTFACGIPQHSRERSKVVRREPRSFRHTPERSEPLRDAKASVAHVPDR